MSLFGSILKSIPGPIGSIASAIDSKGAVKDANAATQLGISNASSGLNTQLGLSQARLDPYEQSGTGALAQLNNLLGIATPGSAGTQDYSAYVQNNPDLLADYAKHPEFAGNMAGYGAWHYNKYGQNEGRQVPIVGATEGTAGGGDAQAGAISALQASPLYQSLYRNGLDSVLNNASATGGLRGGNAQRSLYNLGTDTLSQVIQQQIANLSGLSGQGLNATTTGAGLGANVANTNAGLATGAGQANAGAILGNQTIDNSLFSGIRQSIQNAVAAGAGGVPGGGGGSGGFDIGSALSSLFSGGGSKPSIGAAVPASPTGFKF